jgi:ankyrin repeat protein
MRSIASRVPVQFDWQNFSNSSSELASPTQASPPSSAKNFIEAKAVELRSAILTGNHDVTYAILGGPDASQIALATDAYGQNALFYAIGNNDLLAMDYLLTLPVSGKLVLQRSDQGKLPLSVAAQRGSIVAVRQLLEMNSAQEQISVALSSTKELDRGNPLMHAAGNGHAAVVKILLDSPFAGPLVQGKTSGGLSSLMLAAYRGHEEVVKVLLASTYAEELTQSSDTQSVNALLAATYKGRAAIVELLLETPFAAGLLQGRNKEGFNVLMVAAQDGHEEVVKILLASDYAKTLVKETNLQGCNALLFSTIKNHVSVTRALLEFGLIEQQLAVTYQGLSVVDIALKKGYQDVAAVLLQYGAVSTRNKASGQSMMLTATDIYINQVRSGL